MIFLFVFSRFSACVESSCEGLCFLEVLSMLRTEGLEVADWAGVIYSWDGCFGAFFGLLLL